MVQPYKYPHNIGQFQTLNPGSSTAFHSQAQTDSVKKSANKKGRLQNGLLSLENRGSRYRE
jgi:hypothetical protein